MNLNLKQIETFVWVADLGSFRKAAERLNTTQPNISNRIAALESALGVTLMERDAGSVVLTDRGQQLLDPARSVLKQVEVFIGTVDDERLIEGALRLGVTEMVVHTWLPSFLKVFKQHFPNVDVELTVDFSRSLEEMLDQHALDLTFQSGPFSKRTSAEISLGEYPMVWVAAPRSQLADRAGISISDMLELPILTHARNTQPYEEVVAHFAKHSSSPARIVPSTNLAACLQMTMDGYGVSALLAPMVEKEVAAGQLFVLDYKWKPSSLQFFARYDEQKSSAVVAEAAQLAAATSKEFADRYAK